MADKVTRASGKLLGYHGPNPFREVQARDFFDEKVTTEFYATSAFHSLFNEQHEILVGTRGSGKTFLLKMLSYSMLRNSQQDSLQQHAQQRRFIGFYVPLHLEFLSLFKRTPYREEQLLEYFQFCFNCSAAVSLLYETETLLKDIVEDPVQRLLTESTIVRDLIELWGLKEETGDRLDDVSWQIILTFQKAEAWCDGSRQQLPQFSNHLLRPLIPAINRIMKYLGLSGANTKWLACIDEAEFLPSSFQKCINTFMRSDSKPIVVKMATLPYKHLTLETLSDDVLIQAKGHDFSYVDVDMQVDGDDFLGFTNFIIKSRLGRLALTIDCATLEDFLGKIGRDDPLDYFVLETSPKYLSKEVRLKAVIDSMSSKRTSRFQDIRTKEGGDGGRAYLNRFSPVYYVREMRRLSKKGNRTVGWFAGATVIRQVSEGNPRRFIRIINRLFEEATATSLTPKNQHRVIASFCKEELETSDGLPGFGPLTQSLIQLLGILLQQRVHSGTLVDAGCGFKLSPTLWNVRDLIDAIQLAIDYSHIVVIGPSSRSLSPESELRLSFLHAVNFWLPLRKGAPLILQSRNLEVQGAPPVPSQMDLNRRASKQILAKIQLKLFEDLNAH